MANQVTKMSDVINPQVMGSMIEARINAMSRITPYARLDTTLEGVPGDTKTVPCWNYIGDAEDFNPENATGAEIETTKLTASSTTFTVKCAGKSVAILQTAINSGLGDPIGQAETQLAKSIVSKVDNDVLDAAYTSKNIHNGVADDIGYKGIVAAVSKFEDEEDGTEKVLFINPKQEAALLCDSDFVSADKFEAGVAVNGSIGKIAGCWIKKSKKVKLIPTYAKDNTNGTITIVAETVTETTTNKRLSTIQPFCADTLAVGNKVTKVTDNAYLCPIIKLEPGSEDTEYTEAELPALTIFLKKDTQVDHEWFPKKQKHDVTATKYYGVALTNASKVVLGAFGVNAAQ